MRPFERVPASVWLIAPYAAWMVLMMSLPSTPWAYAARTAVTAVLLVGWWLRERATGSSSCSSSSGCSGLASLAWGIGAGLAVFAIWVFPERFEWYRRLCIVGEGGTKAIAESETWLIAIRLIGSAFVISIAEELFFRKFLIRFAGFWWMVVLFAIEHDRWLVGAIAGVVYGVVYLRRGLLAAVIAHMTTNLVLGGYVLMTGEWQFW